MIGEPWRTSIRVGDERSEVDEGRVRAALYARTSTPNQNWGRSLEEQIREARERCEIRGWEVCFIFRDRSESGSDTDRPMFQEMMTGARKGYFDVIVFWKLDRFSRSLIHAVQIEEDLQKQDVALHSVTEQIDTTTPTGRFNFRNLVNAAELEREIIKQRTQLGMNALASEGKWPNDCPPLGYNKGEDGRLRVDSEESMLVRTIFSRYRELKSMPEVAYNLNEQEVVTKDGNKWDARAIRDILRNELYMGIYSVGSVKREISDYQIIQKDEFREVTRLRFRFQRNNQPRENMGIDRKEDLIYNIFEQYESYLRATQS